MTKSILSILLISVLTLIACSQSQLQQFKSGWIGGIDAFHAFNQAITNNPNIDIVLRARIAALDPKFQASKPLVQNLVDFPPENKAELVALLKDAIPLVHEIAGNSESGNLIVIAATAAETYFQVESDMLSPPIAVASSSDARSD